MSHKVTVITFIQYVDDGSEPFVGVVAGELDAEAKKKWRDQYPEDEGDLYFRETHVYPNNESIFELIFADGEQ